VPDLTIDEAARRLGAIVWLERRLFEVLGAWSVSTTEDAVKLALARRSVHHGTHATAVTSVLPETRDHRLEQLVRPLHPGTDALVAAIASREGSAARVAGLVDELLPRQLEACEAFLEEASPVRDGPAIRVLIPVLAEERAEVTDLAALGRTLT
jgi:hypothetical protein